MPEPRFVERGYELFEVLSETAKDSRKPAGYNVRRLNTGRGDYGSQYSAMSTWIPQDWARPADMSRWQFNSAANRFTRRA